MLPATTLSDLFCQDEPQGALLLESPVNDPTESDLYNNGRYVRHMTGINGYSAQNIRPMKFCPVVGNKLPMLVREPPSDLIHNHWGKWVPGFVMPNYLKFDLKCLPEMKIICATFPQERIGKELHAVDPDVHYEVLSKKSIPQMGCTHPVYYLSMGEAVYPCFIKGSQFSTHFANTKEDAETIVDKLVSLGNTVASLSFIEAIEHVTHDHSVNVYLRRTGEVQWLGASEQILRNYRWGGAITDARKQGELREKLIPCATPVAEYLHKKGFFGFVSMDIVENSSGCFVTDVNARVSDSAPIVMLMPKMAKLGLPAGLMTWFDSRVDEEGFAQEVDEINSDLAGSIRVIILSLNLVNERLAVCMCVFGQTSELVDQCSERVKKL